MATKIRRLEKTDTEALQSIYKFTSVTENTSQLPYFSPEIISDLLVSSNSYTLVADVDGRAVGHVTFMLSSKPRERHSAQLAIAVHPEIHGQGIGRRLMEEAISQADNWLNLIRLELEVQPDNTIARSLYEKLGFELEGEKRFATFKAGKYVNLYVMSRIGSNIQESSP